MRSSIHLRRSRFAAKRMRRGVSTAALGTSICALIFIVIMAVGLSQLSYYRQEAHTGTDSASLAGVPQLMDLRPLYDGDFWALAEFDKDFNGSLDGVFATQPELFAHLIEAQTKTARDKAIEFAAFNEISSTAIVLDRNDANAADGDIVVGWLDDPADSAGMVIPVSGWTDSTPTPDFPEGALNTIEIREARNTGSGGGLSVWLGDKVFPDGVQMNIESYATVDQRIMGLKPLSPQLDLNGDPVQSTSRVKIPLLPIFVMPEAGDESNPTVAHLWWAKGAEHSYVVDCQSQTHALGEDGIAEMVVRIPLTGTVVPPPTGSREGGIVRFSSDPIDFSALQTLAEEGYAASDLSNIDELNGPAGKVDGELRLDTSLLSLVNTNYEWTASTSAGAVDEYYLTLAGGGDPALLDPIYLLGDGSNLTKGTTGSLATGEWGFGDEDSLGFQTIYVRLSSGDPNPDNRPEDFVEVLEGDLVALADYEFEAGGISELLTLFTSSDIMGKTRIIPLAVPDTDSGRCRIYGFAAGTVVFAEILDDSLLVHIQPCVMQTPTAIVGATTSRNPWIGKILISR